MAAAAGGRLQQPLRNALLIWAAAAARHAMPARPTRMIRQQQQQEQQHQQQQQQQQQQGDDPDNDDDDDEEEDEDEEEEEEFLDRQSAAEALQTWAVVARDMLTEEGVDIPATTDAAQPPPPRADDDTELILVNRATKCRVVQPEVDETDVYIEIAQPCKSTTLCYM